MALSKGRLSPEVDILLPLAARTAEHPTSLERYNPGYTGALVIINATAMPAGGLVLFMEAKDTPSDGWAVIYQSGTLATATMHRFFFQPGISGGSGINIAGLRLPAIYRFRIGVLDATSITYSAIAHLLP